MEGLKVTLECIYQVNIELGHGGDILNVEKGEQVECEIEDYGIRIRIEENYWSALFKPSALKKYFKVIQ